MNDASKQPIYIIIPVHNRREMTLACLEYLSQCKVLIRYFVVIVDDGSTDDTGEAIRTLYPDVIVLEGDGNLWWTGAIALGMEFAASQGGKHVIWLNDDCLPESTALSRLVEFMHTHPDTIVAPACQIAGSGVPVENGCRRQQRITAQPGEVIYVESLSGYCVGIPESVYRKIGLPNAQRFPQYRGDDTYILRATRSQFKACILGDAKILLQGVEDAEHGFISYLNHRFPSNPSFATVFLSKKSRYFLPCQFFYLVEKYSLIPGIFLFFIKVLFWLEKYLYLRLKRVNRLRDF
jgi:GT2 family glycosyltransferase